MEQSVTINTASEHEHHDEHRDDEASKLGMWLFLFTEILLFGVLFLVYTIYRYLNPEDFSGASMHLDVFMGTLNTVVLLISSFTVATSITAVQQKNYKLAKIMIILTMVAALIFLVNKYFEWGHKIELGLYPGKDGATFPYLPAGERLFFVLYYFMTGLHGLHVIIGATLLAIAGKRVQDGKVTHDNFVFLENAGLYWHLVDLIWIFLFPLLYLIH